MFDVLTLLDHGKSGWTNSKKQIWKLQLKGEKSWLPKATENSLKRFFFLIENDENSVSQNELFFEVLLLTLLIELQS